MISTIWSLTGEVFALPEIRSGMGRYFRSRKTTELRHLWQNLKQNPVSTDFSSTPSDMIYNLWIILGHFGWSGTKIGPYRILRILSSITFLGRENRSIPVTWTILVLDGEVQAVTNMVDLKDTKIKN